VFGKPVVEVTNTAEVVAHIVGNETIQAADKNF